jgi:hypothetical protein
MDPRLPTTSEEFNSAIIAIFSEIRKDTFMGVFRDWIRRVKWVTKTSM